MNTSLFQALADFDGKRVDPLVRVTQIKPASDDIDFLLSVAVDEPKLEQATTWIILYWLQAGETLSGTQTSKLIDVSQNFGHWEAKLHVAQMIEFLDVNDKDAGKLQKLLVAFTGDDKKLVRAWSYNGLAELAKQHPVLRTKVLKTLEAGKSDEAASVRARLKKILKDLS